MRIDRTALIMLAAAHCERARRQAAEEASIMEAKEQLIAQLEEIGWRMLTVTPPGKDPGKVAALAQELAQATDWAHIDTLRVPHDLAPIEAVALVLMINPDRALQLLAEYPG